MTKFPIAERNWDNKTKCNFQKTKISKCKREWIFIEYIYLWMFFFFFELRKIQSFHVYRWWFEYSQFTYNNENCTSSTMDHEIFSEITCYRICRFLGRSRIYRQLFSHLNVQQLIDFELKQKKADEENEKVFTF